MIKRLFVLAAASALLLTSSYSTVRAAEFINEERATVINETKKDLHIVSRDTTFNAPITGDLLVASGDVTINERVENSLFVLAGTAVVRGSVGKHARIVGGDTIISGTVNGDLFIVGGTVTITSEAKVLGSVYAAAGTLSINGEVSGSVIAAGQEIIIAGKTGSLDLYVDRLKLESTAVVNGDLSYSSPSSATLVAGYTVSGQTLYTVAKPSKQFVTITQVLLLLGSILLALLLVKFLPKRLNQYSTEATTNTLNSFGVGLAFTVIMPMITVMLFATYIGAPIALIFLSLTALVILTGFIVGKIVFGAWLMATATKSKIQLSWQSALVGVLVVWVVAKIPYVGWVLPFAVFACGVGAVAAVQRRLLSDQ